MIVGTVDAVINILVLNSIFNHLFLNFDYCIQKYGKFDIEGMGCIYYTKSRFSECWGVIAFDYTSIQAIAPPRKSPSKYTKSREKDL